MRGCQSQAKASPVGVFPDTFAKLCGVVSRRRKPRRPAQIPRCICQTLWIAKFSRKCKLHRSTQFLRCVCRTLRDCRTQSQAKALSTGAFPGAFIRPYGYQTQLQAKSSPLAQLLHQPRLQPVVAYIHVRFLACKFASLSDSPSHRCASGPQTDWHGQPPRGLRRFCASSTRPAGQPFALHNVLRRPLRAQVFILHGPKGVAD